MMQSNILRKPVYIYSQSVESSKILTQTECVVEDSIKKIIHAYIDKHKYVEENNNLIQLSRR